MSRPQEGGGKSTGNPLEVGKNGEEEGGLLFQMVKPFTNRNDRITTAHFLFALTSDSGALTSFITYLLGVALSGKIRLS